MNLLRKKEDLRTFLFLLFATVQSLLLFFWNFSHLSIFEFLFWFALSSFIVFIVSVINHNHRHCSIFHFYWLNRSVDYLISFCMGAPSTRLHQVHVMNHHRHYRTSLDWTCYKTTAHGSGLARIFNYVRTASALIRKNRITLDSMDLDMKKQISRERLFLYFSFLITAIFNFKMFLFLWLPTRFTGLLFLFVSNLMNHDGCELETKYDHSRDFLNPIENWVFFNSGYHTAHHASAGTHWSDLPNLHRERIAKQKNPLFVENSLFVYALETLWPLTRIGSNSFTHPFKKGH